MISADSQSYEVGTEIPTMPGETLADYHHLFLSGTPLLDVRAPVEFEKGAFPSSVNLPLMTDEERHLVGIRYKEQGQKRAIDLGAELVTPQKRRERIAAWRKFIQRHPDAALYCFRGGLRSRITQLWLQENGIDIPLVTGGYKALRRYLVESLDRLCSLMNLILIGGRTGNGKTQLLQQLGQMVDLESLANHRGSSFGGMGATQPSNIDFEHAVSIALLRLEHVGADTVFMEDEAKLIGRVCIPDRLRETMQCAPLLILECDMERRINHVFDDYVPELLNRYMQLYGAEAGFEAFGEHHRSSLARIRRRFGGANYNKALELLEIALFQHQSNDDTSHYIEFIELLLRGYYDPMYDYQLGKKQERVVFKGDAHEIIRWINTVE